MARYLELSTRSELSPESVTQAMGRLGVPIYTLRVHPDDITDATATLKLLGAEQVLNPFLVQVNIKADGLLNPKEWFIESGNARIGGKG